jgi:hypothetical protein
LLLCALLTAPALSQSYTTVLQNFQPCAVTVSAGGSIYIATCATGAVQEFSSAGQLQTTFTAHTSSALAALPNSANLNPVALAFSCG